MRHLITLLLLLTYSLSSYAAAPPTFTPEEQKNIRLTVKVADLWIKYARTQANEESLSDDEWQKSLREYVRDIMKVNVEESSSSILPIEAQELIKETEKTLSKLNWTKIEQAARTLATNTKTMARLHGMGLVAAITASAVAEVTVPIIYASVGLAHLIPTSLATPYQVIALTSYGTAKHILTRNHLIKLLGSKEEYKKFIDSEKQLRLDLQLNHISDVLIPVFSDNGNNIVASVSAPSFKRKALNKVGLSKIGLTFSTLLTYCTKQNLQSDFAKSLDEFVGLGEIEKAFILLNRIGATATDKQLAEFWMHFDEHLTEINVKSGYEEFRKWVLEFAGVSNLNDAMEILKRTPENVSPALVAQVWKTIVLPELAEFGEGLNYFNYRKLSKNFIKIETSSFQESADKWSEHWLTSHEIYIRQALKQDCPELLNQQPGT